MYKQGEGKQELLKKCGSISQLARVNRYTFSEGKAKGLDAVDINNGSGLDFTVLLGRTLDIHWCQYKGINLSYITKNMLVGPQYVQEGTDGWLRSFNGGLLTTCGIASSGAPSVDLGESLNLHGRIGNAPAEQVAVESYWEGEDYIIRVRGNSYETKLFGENLKLSREIQVKLGENKIYIHDKIENLGYIPSPIMMVYHMNFGYPLLDEGAKMYITSRKSTPTSDISKEKASCQYDVEPPQHGVEENVYFHEMDPERGYGLAALINPKLLENGLGVYIKTDLEELPYFTQWKMMGEGEYVVGLEPCNCMTLGREKERQRGTLRMIQPGEIKDFKIEVGIIEDAEEFLEKYKLL